MNYGKKRGGKDTPQDKFQITEDHLTSGASSHKDHPDPGSVCSGAWNQLRLRNLQGRYRRSPEIDVASIEPSGYATMVYDSKGNLTETLVKSGANRLEASYEELPQCLIELRRD